MRRCAIAKSRGWSKRWLEGDVHQPSAFRSDDAEALELIGLHPLAQLVAVADGLPVATPVPMFVRGDSLVGHLARPNQIWRHQGPALAIFTGPQAYISPRWYENKTVDGKVVPTWNYTTVQVHGRLVAHDDTRWTHQLVSELTERFEAVYPEPWAVSDAPDEFIRTLVRGIVGIELVDLQIVGKLKLSQNRPEVDQQRVAAALTSGSAEEQAVGRTMSGNVGIVR